MLLMPEPAASSVAVSVTVGLLLCHPAAFAGGDTVAAIVGLTVSVIVKSAFETSKKTLPSASIFTRAVAVVTFGIVTASEPSFAVLVREHVRVREAAVRGQADRHVGRAGRRMSVFALSHVIVCAEPPG